VSTKTIAPATRNRSRSSRWVMAVGMGARGAQ
jgi:hypothetical protein